MSQVFVYWNWDVGPSVILSCLIRNLRNEVRLCFGQY